MELALNIWKSQLSRAGTGNSDVLNPWHWALEHGVQNQLSRVMYSKTKGPFRVIVKISPHVVPETPPEGESGECEGELWRSLPV